MTPVDPAKQIAAAAAPAATTPAATTPATTPSATDASIMTPESIERNAVDLAQIKANQRAEAEMLERNAVALAQQKAQQRGEAERLRNGSVFGERNNADRNTFINSEGHRIQFRYPDGSFVQHPENLSQDQIDRGYARNHPQHSSGPNLFERMLYSIPLIGPLLEGIFGGDDENDGYDDYDQGPDGPRGPQRQQPPQDSVATTAATPQEPSVADFNDAVKYLNDHKIPFDPKKPPATIVALANAVKSAQAGEPAAATPQTAAAPPAPAAATPAAAATPPAAKPTNQVNTGAIIKEINALQAKLDSIKAIDRKKDKPGFDYYNYDSRGKAEVAQIEQKISDLKDKMGLHD